MKIHHEPDSQIDAFIDYEGDDLNSAEKKLQYKNYLKMLLPFLKLGPATRMLEIGTGTGWFPIMCGRAGLNCKGLEISPQLVDFAKGLAKKYDTEVDIQLGNIEEHDVGDNEFDAIIASCVFEHVEFWERGLARVYKALRAGGVFFFCSTNKFSFTSGEYDFPLYGWLPDQWRYRLRIAREGPGVMAQCIDFHQFRHGQLRHAFQKVGFARINDRIERLDRKTISNPWKRAAIGACKAIAPLKTLVLTFSDATLFVCIK